MNTSNIDAQSFSYYLPYQIVASVLLALGFILLGLFLAWVFWGHNKRKVAKLKAEQGR